MFFSIQISASGQHNIEWSGTVTPDGTYVRNSADEKAFVLENGAYIKLTGNVNLGSKYLRVVDLNDSEVSKVTLDLNGYVLSTDMGKRVINIEGNDMLTIIDSNPTRQNTVYGFRYKNGSSYTSSGKTYSQIERFTVTVSGGVITGGSGDRGGAIITEGKLYFKGGSIIGCLATRSGDYDDKTGSEAIHKWTDGCGGAIYIQETGYCEMSGNATVAYCATTGLGVSRENFIWGRTYFQGKGGGVFVDAYNEKYATFDLKDNASIHDCFAGNGGGVFLNSVGAVMNMSGSTSIYNCCAHAHWSNTQDQGGGAVYVSAGESSWAVFNMTGGKIYGNKARRGGNGVLVLGKFNIYGDSQIYENVPIDWLGDINVYNRITYADEQDTACGNCHGGGIIACGKNAFITMESGTIRDNYAASGGGVMLWNYSKMVVNGGLFTKNRAIGKGGFGNGGAIYSNGGVCTINGGTITENVAHRCGGAININNSGVIDAELYLNKCTITYNSAKQGGALSQEAGNCSMTVNEDIILSHNKATLTTTDPSSSESLRVLGGCIYVYQGTVTLNGCTLDNNTVETGGPDGNGHGGAIYIGYNVDATNTKVIVPAGREVTMHHNSSLNDGGAIYIRTGSLDVKGKLILYNNVSQNEAGAVYINSGDLTIADCVVHNNSAKSNGGAMSIQGGNITFTKGEIYDNQSGTSGGAVYVGNNSGEQKDIQLSGDGVFRNNSAVQGGGIYVSGDYDISLSGSIIGNKARYNGGGLYVRGGKMTFNGNIQQNTAANGGGLFLYKTEMTITGGIIKENRAVSSGGKPSTAYQGDVGYMTGLGGGIYVYHGDSGKPSKLVFDIQDKSLGLGVYNNEATWGGDDILASGEYTQVTLPNVQNMNLTDFTVPTTYLYWAEDYITNDTGYGNGNKGKGAAWDSDMTNDRYDDAVLSAKPIYTISFGTGEEYKTLINKYLCLELGYEILLVDIVKKGLKKGESAQILISSAKSNGDGTYTVSETPYHALLFVATEDNQEIKQKIAIPGGVWEMKESTWSWGYNIPAAQYHEITNEKQTEAGGKLEYLFTNVRKDESGTPVPLPESDEANVKNRMKSL